MLFNTRRHLKSLIIFAGMAAFASCAQAGLFSSLMEAAGHHALSGASHKITGAAGRPESRGYESPPADVNLPPAGSFEACRDQFPGGKPLSPSIMPTSWRVIPLCASGFAVLYSEASKTPLITVERLSKARLSDAQGEARTNQFYPDPRLAVGARAELSDYHGSGFDRGHMAPAGDQPDTLSMTQSFSLSNIVPQDPENNQKIWAKIESDVRKFARRTSGDVFVYTGPIFDQPGAQTIGRNRVWVPSRLFKLVYDGASGRAWAYILPNQSRVHVEPPISYNQFVSEVGIDPLR